MRHDDIQQYLAKNRQKSKCEKEQRTHLSWRERIAIWDGKEESKQEKHAFST